MTIPSEIIVTLLGAIVALQGWTLVSIVSLKERLARVEQALGL
jgi:hypothetical protein